MKKIYYIIVFKSVESCPKFGLIGAHYKAFFNEQQHLKTWPNINKKIDENPALKKTCDD